MLVFYNFYVIQIRNTLKKRSHGLEKQGYHDKWKNYSSSNKKTSLKPRNPQTQGMAVGRDWNKTHWQIWQGLCLSWVKQVTRRWAFRIALVFLALLFCPLLNAMSGRSIRSISLCLSTRSSNFPSLSVPLCPSTPTWILFCKVLVTSYLTGPYTRCTIIKKPSCPPRSRVSEKWRTPAHAHQMGWAYPRRGRGLGRVWVEVIRGCYLGVSFRLFSQLKIKRRRERIPALRHLNMTAHASPSLMVHLTDWRDRRVDGEALKGYILAFGMWIIGGFDEGEEWTGTIPLFFLWFWLWERVYKILYLLGFYHQVRY